MLSIERFDAVTWDGAVWAVSAVWANGKADLVEIVGASSDGRRRGSDRKPRAVLNVPVADLEWCGAVDFEAIHAALDIAHPRPPEPVVRCHPWSKGKAGRPRKQKEAS